MMDCETRRNKAGAAIRGTRPLSRRLILQGSLLLTSGLGLRAQAGEMSSWLSQPLPTSGQIRKRHQDYWQLVDLINDYREQQQLPRVALSPRLTAVAALHTHDLETSKPHDRYGSLHSWSPHARWKGGPYRSSEKATWPLMWNKPKEITGYSGYGFEIAASEVKSPEHALQEWCKSRSHHEVIVNRGAWAKKRWQWKALGAVFHQGYACAWFGDKLDE